VQPAVASTNTVSLPDEALLGMVIVSVELADPEESETIAGFKVTGKGGKEAEAAIM
jgi:hypothetical protein